MDGAHRNRQSPARSGGGAGARNALNSAYTISLHPAYWDASEPGHDMSIFFAHESIIRSALGACQRVAGFWRGSPGGMQLLPADCEEAGSGGNAKLCVGAFAVCDDCRGGDVEICCNRLRLAT